jgi:hypothetical protein
LIIYGAGAGFGRNASAKRAAAIASNLRICTGVVLAEAVAEFNDYFWTLLAAFGLPSQVARAPL